MTIDEELVTWRELGESPQAVAELINGLMQELAIASASMKDKSEENHDRQTIR